MKIALILPNQLFENPTMLDTFDKNDIIILYEHPLYFTDFKYHNMKLVMHRATMKFYFDYLKHNYDSKVYYFEYDKKLKSSLNKYKYDELHTYNPIDHDVLSELNKITKNIKLYDNPSFICTIQDYNDYISQLKNTKSFFHHSFYIWCRKRFDILMKSDKPLGNKWSFDTENRLPFPKDYTEKINFKIKNNKYLKEAIKYIKHRFDNHGSYDYYLSCDFKQTKEHFKRFIKKQLEDFGPYEDAVSDKIIFGNHSVLSPLINIGFITPKYIINYLQESYKNKKIKSIQSLEGYIRQLFWREFCVLVYLNKNKELENKNFFNHRNKLNKTWYTGETQFDLINNIIKKSLTYGWAHHIERLMYIGNHMLITKTHPRESYKWFMEMFIDAYPWVMVPNVYGMSQFSGGSVMMKRPYFSSSNYIDKMSTYKKKKDIYTKIDDLEWFEVWDALYYNFINSNYEFLKKNYSTANIANIWNKKSKDDKEELLKIAKTYLNKYV